MQSMKVGDAISVLAPAKVNFGLRIGGKEADGYHNIKGVFQAVSLCDVVTVREGRQGTKGCAVTVEGKPIRERNTVVAAYEAFRDVSGIKAEMPSVAITLEKKIPQGGGLGGGSSDAAASVAALERLVGTTLSEAQKKEIAFRIGCDVYFFLLCGAGACALVSGRGENVKPIRPREDFELLLVFPPFSVSTKVAYALLDKRREEIERTGCGKERTLDMMECSGESAEEVYGRPIKTWTFVNDFTASVCASFPIVASILQKLLEYGAAFCEMSGSGSTLYGVFDAGRGIERAQMRMAEHFEGCRFVRVKPFGGRNEMLRVTAESRL